MPHGARGPTIRFLLEMAAGSPAEERFAARDPRDLESRFLSHFPDHRQSYARDLLDLARASHRLRDNDNIYLGRIESQKADAIAEVKRRLQQPVISAGQTTDIHTLARALAAVDRPESVLQPAASASTGFRAFPRQLVGQPASPGLAVGAARVIQDHVHLFDFKADEILVCDALDPNMTFVAPLAAAIVERRGGMLIHGSIIAREYGLPCVTGVPKATALIHTGDRLTVDGFLGIVTVQETVSD